MYKNYENRVKEFISEMTNPSSQIVITDLSEKVDNARVEIIKENSLKKPFIFKGYTNEIDRIIDTEKNNKLLYNLPDYPEKKSATKRKLSPSPPKINFHIEVPNRNTIDTVNSNNYNNLKPETNNNTLLSNSLDSKRMRNIRRMSIAEKRQINDLIKKDAILQPQMRFRARTDLERVYDALNGKYIKKNEREIIERQLKNINLYNYMKPKELLKGRQKINIKVENDNDEGNKVTHTKSTNKNSFKEVGIKRIYGPSKVYYEAKNNDIKSWARKDNLNSEARGLLSFYHIKTHFKATEEIAEYHGKQKKKIKDTCFLLPHLLPKNYKQKTLENVICPSDNSEGNLLKNKSAANNINNVLDYSDCDSDQLFKFAEDHEKDEMDDNNNYDTNANNNNPIIKDKIKFDPKKIEILTKMAFGKDEGKEEISDNIMNKNKNDEDENNGNSSNMNPDNNMSLVAKKILNECNVISHKSKYNDTIIKSNGGKTMITKGMTIEEFRNKYKLKY